MGWVKIYFNVQDAPPVPIEDGYYLFKLPASGVLQTSSTMEYGWANDEYFYFTTENRRRLPGTVWGGGGMIWGEHNGESSSPAKDVSTYQGFFVGSESEYKDYGRYVDEEAPGPLDKKAIELKKKHAGIP